MPTFVFTSPATDLRTGRHGTLVLSSEAALRHGGDPYSALILVEHPEDIRDPVRGRSGVRLADVESLEVTSDTSHTSGNPGTFPETSVVTLRTKDGSAVVYGLSRSNPRLVRAVFAEAGWTGRGTRRAPTGALAETV